MPINNNPSDFEKYYGNYSEDMREMPTIPLDGLPEFVELSLKIIGLHVDAGNYEWAEFELDLDCFIVLAHGYGGAFHLLCRGYKAIMQLHFEGNRLYDEE